jgi:tetratricopeptide (TPR) repeat protein
MRTTSKLDNMASLFRKPACLILLFLFATPLTIIFSQEIAKDKIIDTVKCDLKKGQSYSIYLPPQYDAKKSWPVILIFDPAARGKIGVSQFQPAGKKYGFIIACSNNSRNGALGDNFNAAAAMLQDLEERFSIDKKRIYAAGFSGGSRFALALASREKIISGVIGCGAGLPNDRNFTPAYNSDFLYYGIAGNRDMNYLELHDLPAYLSGKTKVIPYFRTFSGGHQWPGPDLITEAVEWIIMKTMKKNIIPSDLSFITYNENKTRILINTLLTEGNQTDAMIYIRFAVRDFPDTPFASEITQKIKNLEASTDYTKAIRRWNKMAALEQEQREKYMNYLEKILNSGSIPDSAALWWKNEVSSLTRLRDKGNAENSQMAYRMLNFISILCSEQGTALYRQNYFPQASLLFKICTMSDSENPNNYYNLARSLARSGKIKDSVDALSSAFNYGLNSRKTVESDPAFANFKNDPKYKGLISKMK